MKLSGLASENVQEKNKETLYSGFLKLFRYNIRHGLFRGGWSEQLQREAVVRPPSVGVLLFDPDLEQVILVEQFRIGPYLSDDDPWLLEVVAGISEPGESLESVALREVKEEADYDVRYLLPVTNFYVSPGASNEKLMLYCGIVDARETGGIYGLSEEGEDIKVHVIPCFDAYKMIEDGRIANASTVIGLQWLKLNQDELKQYARTQTPISKN